MKKGTWTHEEHQFLKDNYNTLTNIQIAEHLERSVPSVNGQARKLKLQKPKSFRNKINGQNRRTNTFTEDIFSNGVISYQHAYFLGFVYADGYLFEPTGTLNIRLKEEDGDLLYQFKDFLNYSGKVASGLHGEDNKYRYKQLVVNSLAFAADLKKLGVHQDKSHTIVWPEFIPQAFVREFMRGYFDGDGTAGIYKEKQISVLGTEEFLLNYDRVIVSNVQTPPRNIHKFKHSSVRYIKFSGNLIAPKVLTWLYEDYFNGKCEFKIQRKLKRVLNVLES